MQATFLRLIQSDPHDFWGDAVNFDVHLQSGHTIFCPCHFEIHVAKMILITHNVRKYGELIALLNQAHGYACHGGFGRNASIHQG